jgi:hypothetical protein
MFRAEVNKMLYLFEILYLNLNILRFSDLFSTKALSFKNHII